MRSVYCGRCGKGRAGRRFCFGSGIGKRQGWMGLRQVRRFGTSGRSGGSFSLCGPGGWRRWGAGCDRLAHFGGVAAEQRGLAGATGESGVEDSVSAGAAPSLWDLSCSSSWRAWRLCGKTRPDRLTESQTARFFPRAKPPPSRQAAKQRGKPPTPGFNPNLSPIFFAAALRETQIEESYRKSDCPALPFLQALSTPSGAGKWHR
jgi:hypothetical protein